MVVFMVGYNYKFWMSFDSYVLVRDHILRLGIVWFEYLFLNATPFLPRHYPFLLILYLACVGLNFDHMSKMVDYCTKGAYGDSMMAIGVIPVGVFTYTAFMIALL